LRVLNPPEPHAPGKTRLKRGCRRDIGATKSCPRVEIASPDRMMDNYHRLC